MMINNDHFIEPHLSATDDLGCMTLSNVLLYTFYIQLGKCDR